MLAIVNLDDAICLQFGKAGVFLCDAFGLALGLAAVALGGLLPEVFDLVGAFLNDAIKLLTLPRAIDIVNLHAAIVAPFIAFREMVEAVAGVRIPCGEVEGPALLRNGVVEADRSMTG